MFEGETETIWISICYYFVTKFLLQAKFLCIFFNEKKKKKNYIDKEMKITKIMYNKMCGYNFGKILYITY